MARTITPIRGWHNRRSIVKIFKVDFHYHFLLLINTEEIRNIFQSWETDIFFWNPVSISICIPYLLNLFLWINLILPWVQRQLPCSPWTVGSQDTCWIQQKHYRHASLLCSSIRCICIYRAIKIIGCNITWAIDQMGNSPIFIKGHADSFR